MGYRDTKEFYQKLTHTHHDHQTISIWWSPLFFLLWVIVFVVVLFTCNTLPTPIFEHEETLHPHSFIGERAMKYNLGITNIGSKVVGSEINEVIAIQYLKTEIQKIIDEKTAVHSIEVDIQSGSGSFHLTTMTTVYRNVQNIIVKLSPANVTTENSLLLNTHYDSVPTSPGGGDSCTMVAVMLEVLRVMSQYSRPFKHSVIFLFNGAEENGLQASHLFITQHKWAEDIRAYFNLDAAGSGGKEIMFQSKGIPWMMDIYNKVAPHPMATVLLEEIFHNGLIPSDTDYRIFRDYGKIAGMDFAMFENGYVYHTSNDVAEIIPIGTFQNIGDNILAITIEAANSPDLPNTSNIPSEPAVFYDIFRCFVMSYSKTVGVIINVVVAGITLAIIILCIVRFKEHLDLDWLTISLEFVVILVLQIFTLCLAVGIIVLLSTIFDAASRSMSWYSNQWLIIGLYYFPLFFGLGIVPAAYLSFRNRNSIRLSYYVQMFLHAQCICYVFVILVMTGLGFRAGFLILIVLSFYTLTTCINLFTGLMLTDGGWIIIHSIGQIIPFGFLIYNTLMMLPILIPIQGRAGIVTNPDMFIGVIVAISGVLLCGLIVPVLCVFRRPVLILCGFVVIFLVFLGLMITPIGFPYRETDSPQRFWIYHTERNFYNSDNTLLKSDSGFFMLPMDRHSNQYIQDLVPQMSLLQNTSASCSSEIFCGVPLYTTRQIGQSPHSNWIPSGKPVFSNRTELKFTSEQLLENNIKRLTFVVSGPTHKNLYIYPLPDNEMINWTLLDAVPEVVPNFNNRSAYFVFIGHGKMNEPLEFSIDIEKTPDTINLPSVQITVVGHYNHGNRRTSEFEEFLDAFPNWSHITPWMCAYHSQVY